MVAAIQPQIASAEDQKDSLAACVVFFEPPSLDKRIVNQFGLLSFLDRADVVFNK